MKYEDKTRLEYTIMPFSMRDIEVAVNIYIWLVYNDFTMEDLRENLEHIRFIKRRTAKNGFWIPLSPQTPYQDFPYSLMKIFQKQLRALENGETTIEELRNIYKEERKHVLEHESYGRKACKTCTEKQKRDWPMDVLR